VSKKAGTVHSLAGLLMPMTALKGAINVTAFNVAENPGRDKEMVDRFTRLIGMLNQTASFTQQFRH
jgi:hypothetical protein